MTKFDLIIGADIDKAEACAILLWLPVTLRPASFPLLVMHNRLNLWHTSDMKLLRACLSNFTTLVLYRLVILLL